MYLLPMAHGLDQYLANRLTRDGVVQVVADPKKADAIITDRLGESFERRLDDLFPPPKPAAKEKDTDEQGGSMLVAETSGLPAGTFSRGKGTLFVVSSKTRTVVWSIFEPAKSTRPEELNRTAERIAKQFTQDLKKRD